MADTQQRKYYKLFTGTNQDEGYDKIHLGYEATTTEITFKKDTATYFHVPYFADSQVLTESTLVGDGAIPGPIPALADRVFKKLGDYGNSTPWGITSDYQDGNWLCSWLYAVSSEPPQWLDRYYNPGRIAYEEALEGRAEFTDYIKNDPIYYDVPSTLSLEPGVQYQYFHQGEKTAADIINTFAGNDKTRLRLSIDSWAENTVDTSIYDNTIVIKNFNPNWVVSLPDSGYQDRSSLSFNHTDFIDCKVKHDTSYNLEDEFTLSFWVRNENWSHGTNTQLVGNLRKDGFGVFYNNLNNNPFFAIPENRYGHLFYVNQDATVYLDKNTQLLLGQASNPAFISLNSNSEVIVIETISNRILKYNHTGDVLTFSKTITGNNLQLTGEPKQLILDGADNSIVVTTSGTYIFDKDLLLKEYTASKPYGYNEQLAFNMAGNLVRELSCRDIKFDTYNQKWVIRDDGNVYCDNVYIDSVPTNNLTDPGTNTNLAIDPEGNLWVLAGSDLIYKINTATKKLVDEFNIGISTGDLDIKNIGFIKQYTRSTNSFTWYAVIYHNYEKNLYFVTLDGDIYKNIYLPEKLNIYESATSLQDSTILNFTGKGDFTGYERRRIFNKTLFNNNPQIEFKASVKSPNRSIPNSIYTLSIPAHYLLNNTWHLITATLKNHTLRLYVDNYLRNTLEIPGFVDLNYEYKNNFYIGTPSGKIDNINDEIQTKSIIWNGYIDSVKIYDYAVETKFIQYFVREKIKATDIQWNIPTAALQYVEVIDRFFKHRLPGSKSVFFKIRLTGSRITDTNTRQLIENDIKQAVQLIKPAYAELLRFEWFEN